MSDEGPAAQIVRRIVDRLIAMGATPDDAVLLVTLACHALLVAEAAPRLAPLGLTARFFDALTALHREVLHEEIEVDRG